MISTLSYVCTLPMKLGRTRCSFPHCIQSFRRHEYDSLSEQFKKLERQTFGGDGFDIYVEKVATVESSLAFMI